MAECRCGTCEHCVTDAVRGAPTDVPPTPRNDKPRRLLTRMELAELRASCAADSADSADVACLLSAYETAVRLLEECVLDGRIPGQLRAAPLSPIDVAWLALREAER